MNTVIVIPAFEPTEQLPDLIRALKALTPTTPIIVVNDGSSDNKQQLFYEAQSCGAILLEHAINLGKGAALKTAFNYILIEYRHKPMHVVTADADGQHAPADILKVCESLTKEPHKLWIGARKFDENVPLKSQLGNTVTRHVFRFLVGKKLFDTQSGLRGIPFQFLKTLMRVKATRYEFELDMLIEAAKLKLPIEETPIQTIYIDNNAGSHFHPLLDSLRIYFVFIRFCGLSLVTALLDFIVFSIAYLLAGHIFLSFVIARLVAGSFNFMMGKRWIFYSKASVLPEALKFSTLVIVLMTLSYLAVNALTLHTGLNVFVSKILVEGSLFLISFAAQQLFVFNRSEESPLQMPG